MKKDTLYLKYKGKKYLLDKIYYDNRDFIEFEKIIELIRNDNIDKDFINIIPDVFFKHIFIDGGYKTYVDVLGLSYLSKFINDYDFYESLSNLIFSNSQKKYAVEIFCNTGTIILSKVENKIDVTKFKKADKAIREFCENTRIKLSDFSKLQYRLNNRKGK